MFPSGITSAAWFTHVHFFGCIYHLNIFEHVPLSPHILYQIFPSFFTLKQNINKNKQPKTNSSPGLPPDLSQTTADMTVPPTVPRLACHALRLSFPFRIQCRGCGRDADWGGGYGYIPRSLTVRPPKNGGLVGKDDPFLYLKKRVRNFVQRRNLC